MFIEEDIELGNYPGVQREIVYVPPFDIIIRFYPYGNDEWDIEYKKIYNSKQSLLDSIAKYKSETFQAIEKSTYDAELINASMIQLLKDVVDRKVHLPDNAEGFNLRGDIDHYKSIISAAQSGSNCGFTQ